MWIVFPYGITGLTATVNIYDLSDDSLVVTAGGLSEIGTTGIYKYDFSLYDNTKDYTWISDGGAGLEDDIRYIYGASESDYNKQMTDVQADLDNPDQYKADLTGLDTMITFLFNIEGGKWEMTSNQLIMYKSDNITEVARFNLFNAAGNPAMDNITKVERG